MQGGRSAIAYGEGRCATSLIVLHLCCFLGSCVTLSHLTKSSPQKPVIPFQYILPIVMGLQTHMSHAHLKPAFLLACTDKTQMLPQCRLSRACSAPALTEDLQKPLQQVQLLKMNI